MVVSDEIKVVPPADPPVDAASLRLRMVPLLILIRCYSSVSGMLGSHWAVPRITAPDSLCYRLSERYDRLNRLRHKRIRERNDCLNLL